MSIAFSGCAKDEKVSYGRALAGAKNIGNVMGIAPRTFRVNGKKEKHWCVWVDIAKPHPFAPGLRSVLRKRKLFPRFKGDIQRFI